MEDDLQTTFGGALAGFAVTLPLYAHFTIGTPEMQFVEAVEWIPRFNVNYLLDVLNNVAGSDVECLFGDAASSALMSFPSEAEFKYVVMPMRI